MRFLADESCDAAIVRALRDAGHDVTAVAGALRGADDRTVLDAALQEGRLVLTEDKDFGELVFAAGALAVGVLLLRHSSSARSHLSRKVVAFVHERQTELPGSFVVITPGRTRVRRLPGRRGQPVN